MVRDHRANAVPTTNETPIATTPATVTTQSTTSRSWSERNIARAVPTTPATTASTAVSATTPTCQRNDRCRTTHAKTSPSRPAAPAQAAPIPMIAHWSSRHRGLPAVADAPDGHQALGHGRVGLDLLAQPAHVHGHRRLVAERPAPHLLQQLLAGERGAGMARPGSAAGRTPGWSAPARRSPRVASWRPRSTTRSPSSSRPASALVRSPARRSTDSTRSTSSRGLNGLVT